MGFVGAAALRYDRAGAWTWVYRAVLCGCLYLYVYVCPECHWHLAIRLQGTGKMSSIYRNGLAGYEAPGVARKQKECAVELVQ
jgi:hypothetical protein